MAVSSQIKEITEKLEQGIKDLYESDRYAEYLKTMSRFHNYSTRNTLLIYLQRPDASMVAGYSSWKKKFSRNVKEGEKAIKILAPTPFIKQEEKELIDPVTKQPVLDENGMPVVEYSEIKLARFKTVNVFDVKQTDGKPLPSLAQNLSGNVEQYEAFLDALKTVSPLPIVFEPMQNDMDGYCRFGEKIAIREGMSEIQTVCAIIHEMAHAKLHDIEQIRLSNNEAKPKDQRTEEVEAESVSFTVSSHFGIETGDNSFGYIATWSKGRELKELNDSLDTTRKTSNELIDTINDKFMAILKERNIEIVAEEINSIKDESIPEEYIRGGLNNDTKLAAIKDKYGEKSYEYETIKNDMQLSFYEYGSMLNSINAELIKRGYSNIVDDDSHNSQDYLNDYIDKIDLHPADNDYVKIVDYIEKEIKSTVKEFSEIMLPDSTINIADMHNYGYVSDELLPLTKTRAMELYNEDHTIYMLYTDNSESMIFNDAEINAHDGLFGIEREEWMSALDFKQMTTAIENSESSKEADFIYGTGNRFGIYQIRNDIENARDIKFTPLETLEKIGQSVNRLNYELVYTAPLNEHIEYLTDRYPVLNKIYEKFNIDHPEDFTGHSVSVSDVITLKYNGDFSAHYVDSVGFVEIDSFTGHEYQTQVVQKIEEPKTIVPTVTELEADVNAGKEISLMDLANAIKAEETIKIYNPKTTKPKSSLANRLEDSKQRVATQGQQNNQRNKELEVS